MCWGFGRVAPSPVPGVAPPRLALAGGAWWEDCVAVRDRAVLHDHDREIVLCFTINSSFSFLLLLMWAGLTIKAQPLPLLLGH